MTNSRFGVDIGGTFTDCLLSNGSQLAWAKIQTTPDAPEQAVTQAFRGLMDSSQLSISDVADFVHGTTLGLNTLLERRGALCGMLVTRGFRDILELGRLRLPRIFDYMATRPEPLIRRRHVFEVSERMYASGEVHTPLEEAEVDRAVDSLVESGVQAVVVCFLHGYRHPRHEQIAVGRIRERHPSLFVCASSEIWPERGEYERTVTTAINAYVGPRMHQYIDRLDEALRQEGFLGRFLLTKSNGGVMTAERASEIPVETLLSGPAAGVMGAWQIARQAGLKKAIAFDMGGTSADISVLDEGITYTFQNEVANLPLTTPSIDIFSIGSGGGSIARLDPAGVLKVGPTSAGTDPGPACYDLGGVEPTMTDAYVAAAIISPQAFLGGRMKLNLDAAHRALREKLQGSSTHMALQVIKVATATMYSRFVPYLASLGVDSQDFELIAYGGAGPTHAFLLAQEIGIPRILVPPRPGLLCAFGCLVSDLRTDHIVSIAAELHPGSSAVLTSATESLIAQAEDTLTGQRATGNKLLFWSADLRYRGQTHTHTVSLPQTSLSNPEEVAQRFHQHYGALYGQSQTGGPVELINLRLQAVAPVSKDIGDYTGWYDGQSGYNQVPDSRTVHLNGEELQTTVVWRWSLAPNDELIGPVVIEQEDTTVFIPPGWSAKVDTHGNIRARMA